LGERLKLLRTQSGAPLEDVANATNLTKSYLSKIERGLSVPSLSTALKLAHHFRIELGVLLGAERSERDPCITRKSARLPFKKGPPSGPAAYLGDVLAADFRGKRMTPFVIRPPFVLPDPLSLATHDGEEFVFVVSGDVEVVFQDRHEILGAGDSIYFDSRSPHKLRSVGDRRAELLVMVFEGPSPARSIRRKKRRKSE
jgi:transcriptional regulator with XRE-family HTH domain